VSDDAGYSGMSVTGAKPAWLRAIASGKIKIKTNKGSRTGGVLSINDTIFSKSVKLDKKSPR